MNGPAPCPPDVARQTSRGSRPFPSPLPCTSRGSRRHGGLLTKGCAEKLQRRTLPPSRTLSSRHRPCSEDIFILPDIIRGPTPLALQSQPALTDTWLSCQGPSHMAPRATRRRNPEAILACPLRAATWVDPGTGLREPSVAFHPGYSDATPDGSHQGPEAGTVSEGSSRSC